jgi:hypothetical protein
MIYICLTWKQFINNKQKPSITKTTGRHNLHKYGRDLSPIKLIKNIQQCFQNQTSRFYPELDSLSNCQLVKLQLIFSLVESDWTLVRSQLVHLILFIIKNYTYLFISHPIQWTMTWRFQRFSYPKHETKSRPQTSIINVSKILVHAISMKILPAHNRPNHWWSHFFVKNCLDLLSYYTKFPNIYKSRYDTISY